MLSLLDKTSVPKAWDVKHKTLVVCLTGIVILLITLRIYFLDAPFYNSLKMSLIFEFVTENEITKKCLAFSTSFYNNYVSTILYMFPQYISYICISVNIIIVKLHRILDNVAEDSKSITIHEKMETFMEYLSIVINLVSKVDEIYNGNIFWFFTVSLSNMTVWLYIQILLGRCQYFDKHFVTFASDAFGLLVLTTLAASVCYRVSVMLIFHAKISA